MGFAIPASLGIKLAKPNVRPIVLVGDGACQMSFPELSTIFKYNNNSLVIIVNNQGYTTERMIVDGKFNDIVDWNYHKIVDVIGGGKGFKVTTEGELEMVIKEWLSSGGLVVANCVIDKMDTSPALKRFTKSLSKKVRNKGD